MSYDYHKEREYVFTPAGVDTVLKLYENIFNRARNTGCVTVEKAMSGLTGDSWSNLACVDFLIETKRIREVADPLIPGRSHAILKVL